MHTKIIKRWWQIATAPKEEFKDIIGRKFEDVLAEYLTLLLFCGALAGAISFLYYLLKAIYLEIFRNISISYLRLLNYNFGISVSTVFLFLFIGTFVMFIISMFLSATIREIKYIALIKMMFYSCSPLLLFGWIIPAVPGLIIWAITLLAIGIRSQKQSNKKLKGTIQERD